MAALIQQPVSNNAVLVRFKTDTEFNQSILRLLIPLLVFFPYAFWVSGYDIANLTPYVSAVYFALFLYFLTSFTVSIWVYFWPGSKPHRRIAGMTIDALSMVFALSLGDERMLPFFAAMLFTTVGHGVRFGRRYLLGAVLMSLTALLCVAALNPYWQDNIYIPVAFAFSIMVVPIYALVLLARLRRAVADAEERDLEKSRFLARASHDLRQPIHAAGLLSVRLKQSDLSNEQSKLLDKIDSSIASATQMFQSLLDLSNLGSDSVHPSIKPVRVSAIFSDLEDQLGLSAKASGRRIRCVATSRVVLADRALLTAALLNLISNAIKYADKGDILVGCRATGEQLDIWVCDQGIGIASEHLNEVTKEFFRVENEITNRTEGAGLGLSIVTKLTALMGLRFTLQSKQGHGTTAKISGLSVTDEQPDTDGLQIREQPRQLAGLRVLLIDDKPTTLTATCGVMEEWGCTVSPFDRLPKDPPPHDVILADFDAHETSALTNDDTWPASYTNSAAAIVLITGHPLNLTRSNLPFEVVMTLSKPVRPAQLRSLLMSCKAALR